MLAAEQRMSHGPARGECGGSKTGALSQGWSGTGQSSPHWAAAQGQPGKGTGVSLGFLPSSNGCMIQPPSSFEIGQEAAASLQHPHQVHSDSRSPARSCTLAFLDVLPLLARSQSRK